MEGQRKYGVVIAENDNYFREDLLKVLDNLGILLERQGDRYHVSHLPSSEGHASCPSLADFLNILGLIDIWVYNSKQNAVRYVISHPDSIDLVVMNRASHQEGEDDYVQNDIDGFKAADQLRRGDYKGWTALESGHLATHHHLLAEKKKVDDLILRQSPHHLLRYILDRYYATQRARNLVTQRTS